MKKAEVAELKNGLSRYLAHVKRGGTVLIFERDRPVARIVPATASSGGGRSSACGTGAARAHTSWPRWSPGTAPPTPHPREGQRPQGSLGGAPGGEVLGLLRDRGRLLEARRNLIAAWELWTEVTATDSVRRHAERLVEAHPLRAADALQIGAALVAAGDEPAALTFVTLDGAQAEAAEAEGLRVLAA